MSKVEITRSKLDDLAVAISAKSGEPLPLTIAQMQSAVEDIPTPTLVTKSITANGTYHALDDSADGYTDVLVNVPQPSGMKSISISANGTTTEDVTNYANAQITVAVPQPSGTLNITQNGTVDVTNYASAVVNVSGGGGASNFVTGKFTGTTAQKGTALSITLPYTGSGYPIAVVICPTEGAYNSTSGSFYNLLQRYAIAHYSMTKARINIAPSYLGTSGANNQGVVTVVYKNSTSSATTYNRASDMTANSYSSKSASSTNTVTVRFLSNTNMTVFIASTSYGFAADIEYTYWIVYSE